MASLPHKCGAGRKDSKRMDVFLLIGQSNMSRRGVIGDLPDISSPHVHVFRDRVWTEAHEPVVFDKPALAGEGMCLAFGNALYMTTGHEIGLIPCSLGGSGLDQWLPGEPLFETAVEQTKDALDADQDAHLCGILWHQGENDSKHMEKSYTYLKRFRRVIGALKNRLACSPSLPVLVAELGDYLDVNATSLYHRVINSQLHAFAESNPAYCCVTAHDLKDKGDALHFSTASQRRLGLRFACAYVDTVMRLSCSESNREFMDTEYL